MAKRVKATINPEVLVWARTSAAYEIDVVGEKLDLDPEVVRAWESGDEQPSIPQLRKLAELYRRPLAVLYLPAAPMAFRPMHDFRRLPESGFRRFSPELTYEIRSAHQRRQLALELLEEEGENPQKFALTATLETSAEVAGAAIRDALGIDYALQSTWRDPRVALHAWRARVEELGVLVFQASRVSSEEASGFAFWAETLPFVVVNRKDTHGRRVFSLLHEIAHLMLHQSGVSDVEAEGPRPNDDERVEVYCNAVAASALMPRQLFLAEPLVADHQGGKEAWSDGTIKALAATYGVSREAAVRRLLTLGRTTEDFYRRKRSQYGQEFRAQRQREKEKRGDKGIPRNMPLETVADFGRPFVRMLLSRYHAERLSLAEVSGFLGVKVRHIPGIEQTVGLG